MAVVTVAFNCPTYAYYRWQMRKEREGDAIKGIGHDPFFGAYLLAGFLSLLLRGLVIC